MTKSSHPFKIIILLLVSYSFNSLYAQEFNYCGTTEFENEWLKNYISSKGVKASQRDCNYYLPVKIHIVGDDNGIGYSSYFTVLKSFITLNEDFLESGIQFYLDGEINYINNTSWYNHESFTTGTQMMNSNNVSNSINTYIVDNPAGNCGYRSFAGNAIAIAKACNGPNDHTWAHEMGHYLSLPHTFQGWEGTTYSENEVAPRTVGAVDVEYLDGNNCSESGDFFCDTPPDYLSYRWQCDDEGYSEIVLKDPSGAEFRADGNLIMSYAADKCVSNFSLEQQDAMCAYVNDRRSSLIFTGSPLDKVDPSQTELVYPINNEKVGTEVTLRWKENGNATMYVLEISVVPTFTIPSVRELTTDTEFKVSNLKDDKDYYWRVRTLNEFYPDLDIYTDEAVFNTGGTSSTQDFYSKNLKIYPNPISKGTSFLLELNSNQSEEVQFTIYSMDGVAVKSQRSFIKNGSNQLTFNTDLLSSGIYIVQGKGEYHHFIKKIVIE